MGEADAVIGCDLIVTAGQEALSKMGAGRTFAVVNTALSPTSDFPKMPDWNPSVPKLLDGLRTQTGGQLHALDASSIATSLMGDAIAINMFLLGYAWQLGRIPVSLGALDRAIQHNGVEVDFNRQSFLWGRRAAVNLARVESAANQAGASGSGSQVIAFTPRASQKAEDIVADRAQRLTDYQDAAYAKRYLDLIARVRLKDEVLGAQGRLTRAAARYYYKLLANKDEFEVARLYSRPDFLRELESQFEGDYKLHFHLGAWPFARRDAQGQLRKRELGPWMLRAMGLLQHLRGMRGSWLDPFRNAPERRFAQELLARYEADLDLVLERATQGSLEAAVELAALPEKIRGYGHVREAHAAKVESQRAALRARVGQHEPERIAA
jgi:indolepyruvate ferredoxin oxidoreductase